MTALPSPTASVNRRVGDPVFPDAWAADPYIIF